MTDQKAGLEKRQDLAKTIGAKVLNGFSPGPVVFPPMIFPVIFYHPVQIYTEGRICSSVVCYIIRTKIIVERKLFRDAI